MSAEHIPLDLLDRAVVRRRARNVGIAAVVLGCALGGVVGIVTGPLGFAVALVVVAVPVLVLAAGEARRTSWLVGTEVGARALRTRRVELSTADRVDVLITDVRGTRTVGLLASGAPKGKTVNIALAMYAGTGGAELGVYALRKLADALAATSDTRGLALSQLLVAQLQAEARGDGAAERPLYRLGSSAPQGRITQRIDSAAVARFVATLD